MHTHPDLPTCWGKENIGCPSPFEGEGEGGGAILVVGANAENTDPHPVLPPFRGKGLGLWRVFLLLPFIVFQLLLQTAYAAPDFPALGGRVVDEAGVLTPQFKNEISAQLAAHEQATTNQVVVVTLKSLRGYEISDYGYQLGRHWGIGQKGKNNGALLIIAPNERKIRIEAGYGLEGVLTDALSRSIIERAIKPSLRKQNIEQGIRDGVGAILAALNGEYTPPPPTTSSTRHDNVPVGAVLFGILAFLHIITRLVPRGAKQGKGRWFAATGVGGVIGVLFWFLTGVLVLALVLAVVAFLLTLLLDGRSGGGGWGGSGGGWGGGGGGWSGGDGGFSGGGGSFGGGGASGDW